MHDKGPGWRMLADGKDIAHGAVLKRMNQKP